MDIEIEYRPVGSKRNAKCAHCGEPKGYHTKFKLTDGRVKIVCRRN